MHIIVEGQDGTGKNTLIENLRKYIVDVLRVDRYAYYHFKSPPTDMNSADKKRWQRITYERAFRESHYFQWGLWNRSHVGEAVYAPLYRGMDGDWVFELEETFHGRYFCLSSALVLLVYDDLGVLEQREDGRSLGDERERERDLFVRAFEKSNIKKKILVKVDGIDPTEVFHFVAAELRFHEIPEQDNIGWDQVVIRDLNTREV